MSISRNPSDYSYAPGGHFQDMKRKRNVPGRAIRKCIEEGEVTEELNGNIRFEAEVNTVNYWLIADPSNNECVTIYPKGINDSEIDSGFGVASD